MGFVVGTIEIVFVPVPSAWLFVMMMLPALSVTFTMTVAGLGAFRVAALPDNQGDVLITGLPLSDVQRTVQLAGQNATLSAPLCSRMAA